MSGVDAPVELPELIRFEQDGVYILEAGYGRTWDTAVLKSKVRVGDRYVDCELSVAREFIATHDDWQAVVAQRFKQTAEHFLELLDRPD